MWTDKMTEAIDRSNVKDRREDLDRKLKEVI